jgi:isoleucyl-tRNA synthetase
MEAVAQRVAARRHRGVADARPAGVARRRSAVYEKGKDTLDVWFDSGSTHQTVLRGSHAEDSVFPADLYLEGSDQHRGWFHASLLVSCMLNGVPPYKALLTHGFVVDGQGRKMSKSLNNGIEPQEVSNRLGAEILRLWVASSDYSGEITISEEILKRVVESYRRIRNTLRFLLANVADFDLARDAVPLDRMLEIDRYAMLMTRQLQDQVTPCTCATSSTRWSRHCRRSAPKTSAPSTSTFSRTASTRPGSTAKDAAALRRRSGTSPTHCSS